jgi:hypothetical protein
MSEPQVNVQVLSAPPVILFQLGARQPLNVQAAPAQTLNVSVPTVTRPTVQIGASTTALVSMAIGAIQGPRGLQGPPGQRGSLLVGGYATAVNLPPIGDFLPGDYAFVQDTGEIFQIQ